MRTDLTVHVALCFSAVAIGSMVVPLWVAASIVCAIALTKVFVDWYRFGKVMPGYTDYALDNLLVDMVGIALAVTAVMLAVALGIGGGL